MELGAYPWSSLYGWTADAFGVEWQLMLAPEGEPSIAPCLLFTQDNYGRAHEAIETYLSLFPNSEILSMAKNPDGKHVDHCAFTLAGQRFVVMDGAGEHDFRFNEAFSFQVLCRNQAEIDRYWTELGKGGRHGPCGWLSDKFGVSWQIIPDKLEVWMRDRARSERVMAVLMKMGKLDWKALENA